MNATIYALKRDYGRCGQLYRCSTYSPNYETGHTLSTPEVLNIDSIIALGQNLSLPALASKLGISPGTPDSNWSNVQRFMLDIDDLPGDWSVAPDDYIVINNVRYTVSKVDYIDEMGAIYVEGVANQKSNTVPRIVTLNAVTYMRLAGVCSES